MAPAASANAKKYFTLEQPITDDRLFDLLGRAVPILQRSSLKDPIGYEIIPALPEDGGPVLRIVEPNLYPKKAIEVENAESLKQAAQTAEAVADIDKLLGVFYKHDKSGRKGFKAPGFRRITMEVPKTRLKSLLQKPEYSTPIFDFFNEYPDGKLGIIDSIISCSYMEVGIEEGQGREGGARAQADVGAAMGGPPGVGAVNAQISGTNRVHRELKGTYKGEVIIACSYLLMMREKPESHGVLSWFKKRPETTMTQITFSRDSIDPSAPTITTMLPPTRMEGDSEPYLGGSVGVLPDGDVDEAGATPGNDDEELDFLLCN